MISFCDPTPIRLPLTFDTPEEGRALVREQEMAFDARLEAAAAAVCAMGYAGEVAYSRLAEMDGSATYRTYIIDAIYNMTPEMLKKGANYEVR